MLFFKKGRENLVIKSQVIAVWGPGGNNTVKVSWPLANEISKHTTTALVELPCVGIPRLAVEADRLDRNLNVDNAILEYERKNGSPISFCHKIDDNLAVLPINPYGLPDHPVIHKVTKPETLQTFPHYFINQARKGGYSVIVFDCQGVLVSPMTFFALQQANRVVLVVDEPSEIAWTLVNKERLIDTYKIRPDAFIATTNQMTQKYYEEIEDVLKCPVLAKDKIIEAITQVPINHSVDDNKFEATASMEQPEKQVI